MNLTLPQYIESRYREMMAEYGIKRSQCSFAEFLEDSHYDAVKAVPVNTVVRRQVLDSMGDTHVRLLLKFRPEIFPINYIPKYNREKSKSISIKT